MTTPQTQMPAPSPSAVRQAFGVEGVLERLPGGNGQTWRVGDVVLEGSRSTSWSNTAIIGHLRRAPMAALQVLGLANVSPTSTSAVAVDPIVGVEAVIA